MCAVLKQEETRKLLVAAVKAGKTLQQARVGLIIAQFEALDPKVQEEATKKGKERMEKMPAGARDKASNRQVPDEKGGGGGCRERDGVREREGHDESEGECQRRKSE